MGWSTRNVAARDRRVTALASNELRLLPGVSRVVAIWSGHHLDEVASVNSAALWVTVDPSVDYERTKQAVQGVIDGYPGLVHEMETYPDERIRDAQPVVTTTWSFGSTVRTVHSGWSCR